MSVSKAAKTEDRLKALIELRNLLADHIDGCESNRDLATLSRQFVQVVAEIDEIRGADDSKAASIADFRAKLKVV